MKLQYLLQVSGEVGFFEFNYYISFDYILLIIYSVCQFGIVWCIVRNSFGVINVKVYFWICLCMFVELVVFFIGINIKDLKKKKKKKDDKYLYE